MLWVCWGQQIQIQTMQYESLGYTFPNPSRWNKPIGAIREMAIKCPHSPQKGPKQPKWVITWVDGPNQVYRLCRSFNDRLVACFKWHKNTIFHRQFSKYSEVFHCICFGISLSLPDLFPTCCYRGNNRWIQRMLSVMKNVKKRVTSLQASLPRESLACSQVEPLIHAKKPQY